MSDEIIGLLIMQQNLKDKIYYELDMIRLLSKMSNFAIENEARNIDEECFRLIFEDIEKRSWQISELIEELGNN